MPGRESRTSEKHRQLDAHAANNGNQRRRAKHFHRPGSTTTEKANNDIDTYLTC